MSEYGEDEETLSNPDVVTKYKAAAKIVNNAMAAVVAAIKPGVKITDLCETGDSFITDACAKEFKGKDIEKGIAVPTCISVNHCIGHYSPLNENTTELKEGDMVKIDLGAHIDGFIAQSGHTVVVNADASAPLTGKAADAIAAANTAFEAAARLIKPGKKVSDVAPVLAKIAESYGVNLVEGVMSHQMKRFIIDGGKVILNKPQADQKVEEAEFEEGEVYAIDIMVSTGEGKAKVLDEKETTVYRRVFDYEYQLKIKASRELLAEVSKKFSTMLFSLRALENGSAGRTKLGLSDCISHGLIQTYPVTYDKAGEIVAQIKGTILLTSSGSDRITNASLQTIQTDKSVDDEEIKGLLATSLKNKKNKKKEKKAQAAS